MSTSEDTPIIRPQTIDALRDDVRDLRGEVRSLRKADVKTGERMLAIEQSHETWRRNSEERQRVAGEENKKHSASVERLDLSLCSMDLSVGEIAKTVKGFGDTLQEFKFDKELKAAFEAGKAQAVQSSPTLPPAAPMVPANALVTRQGMSTNARIGAWSGGATGGVGVIYLLIELLSR